LAEARDFDFRFVFRGRKEGRNAGRHDRDALLHTQISSGFFNIIPHLPIHCRRQFTASYNIVSLASPPTNSCGAVLQHLRRRALACLHSPLLRPPALRTTGLTRSASSNPDPIQSHQRRDDPKHSPRPWPPPPTPNLRPHSLRKSPPPTQPRTSESATPANPPPTMPCACRKLKATSSPLSKSMHGRRTYRDCIY
jgi:hypothetical protein